MREYEWLENESRASRRTVADGVELLREFAAFDEDEHAEIRVGPLQLPSGDLVGLVNILFDSPLREKVYVASLPTATRFCAICPGTSERDCFEIFRLDGGVVDAQANVLLRDGMRLRAVEVLPFRLPYEPTELDWRIVHHTVYIIRAQERCYRSLRDGLPPGLQHMMPDRRFLDCSRLHGLNMPPLKVIASLIAERDKILRKFSPQKVADALRTFGVRVPRPRPRVH